MLSEVGPTPKEQLAWRAIQDNVRLAQEFVDGLTPEQFRTDRMRFYAVTRCLEIISEAARHLSQSQQDRFPHLPWRQIRDSGNVFRHRYQHVAESQVWMTVTDRLPELLAAAEEALGGATPRTHQPT
ncbi:MAG: hypothetical protein B7Y99_02455 [Caulobacterales bacterium 32-69-10]|nr:MAG: hypothetical protein B7Y99_02455 [Caulobacterales bacterium 32-69-10]